jgi:hypothetical protein
MLQAALAQVVRWLHDGRHEDLSGRQIADLMQSKLPDKTIYAALKHGVDTGDLLTRPGAKRAILHRVAPDSRIAREHEELQALIKPRKAAK